MDEETKKNTSEMRKKGLALASAAVIGASTALFTSSSINKYKDKAVEQTNRVVTGTNGDDWYEDYTEQKPLYLDGGRFIKTYEEEEYQEKAADIFRPTDKSSYEDASEYRRMINDSVILIKRHSLEEKIRQEQDVSRMLQLKKEQERLAALDLFN